MMSFLHGQRTDEHENVVARVSRGKKARSGAKMCLYMFFLGLLLQNLIIFIKKIGLLKYFKQLYRIIELVGDHSRREIPFPTLLSFSQVWLNPSLSAVNPTFPVQKRQIAVPILSLHDPHYCTDRDTGNTYTLTNFFE